MSSERNEQDVNEEKQTEEGTGIAVVDHVLTQGSTLDPTFILILDVAFTILFMVLSGLFWLSAWNLHVGALILIEIGLWGSVKLYVAELRSTKEEDATIKRKQL